MLSAKIKVLLIFFLVQSTLSYGQAKRSSHWFFGWEAGIDFISGTPHADINGKLISIEGSTSISDTAGSLLFYSNGEKVWNKNHSLMPNGTDLIGDQSSAQSSLIVPLPESNSIYYLFTSIGSSSLPGLRYNIIDMNLNAGLGDLTAKNVLLFSHGTEELTGTMHCNSKDYWIIGRGVIKDTLKFYSYLLTAKGLDTPKIAKFNVPTPTWNTVGSLTFSQEGNLLAFSSFGSDIYLFDFDTQTGKLLFKNKILRNINENVYSNAISPDSKKLYITSWIANGYNYLSQFDLTVSDITASRINIDSTDYRNGSPNGYGLIGQLRIAPDQKIYVSRWNQNHPYEINPDTYYSLDSLDVINFPNSDELSCDFQRDFLYLNHKPTMIGLPNFISNFTSSAPLFNNCKVVEPTSNNFYLKIYPNPFHGKIYIETSLPDKSKLKVRLIDMLGRIIPSSTSITDNGLKIRCGFLASAMYIIQVFNNKGVIATKKVIAF